MRVPTSTYRLQINVDFPFARVRALLEYLRALGVGDVYFSPVFQARPRSTHGYDVINPAQFNREVGDEAEFQALSRDLHDRAMGILLDIVPNHMAASENNPWWRDILEHGPASLASRFFDVEWDAPGCNGHIVLPVLGRDLTDAVNDGEIRIAYQNGELVVAYFARTFPLDPATYSLALQDIHDISEPIIAASQTIPPRAVLATEQKQNRRDAGTALKHQLQQWVVEDSHQQDLDRALAGLTPQRVHEILDAQAYNLEFWRTGTRHLNYRRFFDITDLAGVRVEDPDVFATTHSLILELVRSAQIDGLRVDHVDGLRDPQSYLAELRASVGDTYIIVEKILAPDEQLRETWPVEGATGYEFIGLLAGFFCEPDGLSKLTQDYQKRTGSPPFSEIVYQKKRFVIDALFAGELLSLTNELARLASEVAVGVAETALRECIMEVTAALKVYRTYITGAVETYDRCVIREAVNAARHHAPNVPDEAYAFFKRVLFGEHIPEHLESRRLAFIANWQQFSGPAMAKGLEDTSFYTYNRLLALSEVGAHPEHTIASAERLHDVLARRLRRWPYALNASSTHDTKRSEDVRARIQVLTEFSERWRAALDRWIPRYTFPDANEQIMIYQTLLGVWPLHDTQLQSLPARLKVFLRKAAREAKKQTSWLDPDEKYEAALFDFANGLLLDRTFLSEFKPLQEDCAWFGALNSLAQLVIKLTAPGIPDVYQGNESWIFSLVDPDNRQPVDFAALQQEMNTLPDEITPVEAAAMLNNWRNGRIKMQTTRSGLHLRREKPQLFANGDYIALDVRGQYARNVVAYARRRGDTWVLAVTGRFYSQVARMPVGSAWADTMVVLPPSAPRVWRNVLTGERGSSMHLEQIFSVWPVAILVG